MNYFKLIIVTISMFVFFSCNKEDRLTINGDNLYFTNKNNEIFIKYEFSKAQNNYNKKMSTMKVVDKKTGDFVFSQVTKVDDTVMLSIYGNENIIFFSELTKNGIAMGTIEKNTIKVIEQRNGIIFYGEVENESIETMSNDISSIELKEVNFEEGISLLYDYNLLYNSCKKKNEDFIANVNLKIDKEKIEKIEKFINEKENLKGRF